MYECSATLLATLRQLTVLTTKLILYNTTTSSGNALHVKKFIKKFMLSSPSQPFLFSQLVVGQTNYLSYASPPHIFLYVVPP